MTQYDTSKQIIVERTAGESNGTSNFKISFDSPFGKYNDEFTLNQKVEVYSDEENPPTTLIFTGIIEDIRFSGRGAKQTVELTGRDYGAILQDIIVDPRIFKNAEASKIIESLMAQNVSPTLISVNNVNPTTTTIERITFNGVSVFDAIDRVAKIAGFYFYVDEDKDLHFVEKDTILSSEVLDDTNITSAVFRESDQEIYNQITVYGARQLTGAKEIFTVGTDNTGSKFDLTSKPYNVTVNLSGTTNTQLQPGGIVNISNPAEQDVKFLVDFQQKDVILTSGTTAGDNTVPNGSVVIIDYQRSTPLIRRTRDDTSIAAYGPKHKLIVDKNIKDLEEASIVASSTLSELKDPKIEGKVDVAGITNVTPGNLVTVHIPDQGQPSKQYAVYSSIYDLTPTTTLRDNTTSLRLNKKVYDFADTMKEQILRLRELEASDVDTSVTNIEISTGSVGVSGAYQIVQTSIGSGFYFNIPGHDVLNNPRSILGPWVGGSVVLNG